MRADKKGEPWAEQAAMMRRTETWAHLGPPPSKNNLSRSLSLALSLSLFLCLSTDTHIMLMVGSLYMIASIAFGLSKRPRKCLGSPLQPRRLGGSYHLRRASAPLRRDHLGSGMPGSITNGLLK